jgi:hypothetical protein
MIESPPQQGNPNGAQEQENARACKQNQTLYNVSTRPGNFTSSCQSPLQTIALAPVGITAYPCNGCPTSVTDKGPIATGAQFYPNSNASTWPFPPSARSALTRPSQWSKPSAWSMPPSDHSTETANELENKAPYKNTHSRPKYRLDPSTTHFFPKQEGGGNGKNSDDENFNFFPKHMHSG